MRFTCLVIAAFVAGAGRIALSADPAYVVPVEETLANPDLTEEFRKTVRSNVAATQRGEPIVKSGSVPGLEKRIAELRSRLKPVEDIAGRLTRPPADVSATSLQKGILLGAWTAGALQGDRWSGVGRVFRDPLLGPVVIEEYDLNVGNARRTMPRESINIQIRGQPGVYSLHSDPDSGKSMAKLTWVDKAGVAFDMLTEKTDAAGREALRLIAESIKP